VRNGKPVKVATEIKEQPVDYQTTRVAPRPGAPQAPPEAGEPGEKAGPFADIEVAELTPELARRLDVPNTVHGVVITKTEDNSNDLRTGDVIEEVNQQPITSLADYKKIASATNPNQTQVLSVCRHRTRLFVVLRAAAR
jgi:serine protease Do